MKSTFTQYTYSKSQRVRLTSMAEQPSCSVETAASWSAVSASNETGLGASSYSVVGSSFGSSWNFGMQGSSYYFFFTNLVANPVLIAYS